MQTVGIAGVMKCRKEKNMGRFIRKAIQRAKKGYCEEDLYIIHDWFLNTVPYMLDEFAEKTIGYPGFLLAENVHETDYDALMEEWRKIIREISFHFHEAKEPTKEVNQYNEELDKRWMTKEETEEDKKLFDKWVKREHEIESYQEKELRKGMRMFTKYFYDLWW